MLNHWRSDSQFVRNRVLRGLTPLDFDDIRSLLEPVLLKQRAVVQEPNKPVEYVNFVETGIISLMTLARGSLLETAMLGSRGFAPVSVVLGASTSVHRSTVLVSGTALRIRADDLERVMHDRPGIRAHLLRYVQSLMVHGSQTALCGIRHELEQRLASWLCLASDELGGDVIPITHDHLSTNIGLRRSGVTEALNRFEELGFVRKTRGTLQVTNREQLEKRTCCCYKTIANAYVWNKHTHSSCKLEA